jgi:predicted ATPase
LAQQAITAMKSAMGGAAAAFLVALCEAQMHSGHLADALSLTEEGLALGNTLGDHQAEAELLRLKGECLLALDENHHQTAEACFEQALTVSRRQQAKSLELRAVISLARLREKQRRGGELRSLLEPLLAWHGQEPPSADLQRLAIELGL